MTKKEEFMKISSYEEYLARKDEFKGLKMDKDVVKHAATFFPIVSDTKEELYKTLPSKGGSIGR